MQYLQFRLKKVMECDLIGNQRNTILFPSQMRFLKCSSTLQLAGASIKEFIVAMNLALEQN